MTPGAVFDTLHSTLKDQGINMSTEPSAIRETNRFCTYAELTVFFFLNKEEYFEELLKADEAGNAYMRAEPVAMKINALCMERGIDSLPFMKVYPDGETKGDNWFTPYNFSGYAGPSEETHSDIELFDITMSLEGGPFQREDMQTFKDFVMGVVAEVCAEESISFEYHETSEFRRMAVNYIETINVK
jgi:hypothetical protein